MAAISSVLLVLLACFLVSSLSTMQEDFGPIHARDIAAVTGVGMGNFSGTGSTRNATQDGIGRQFSEVLGMDEEQAAAAPYSLQQKDTLPSQAFFDSNEWEAIEDEADYDMRATMPELIPLHGLRRLEGLRTNTRRTTVSFNLDSGTWRHTRYVQNKPYVGPYALVRGKSVLTIQRGAPQQTYAYFEMAFDPKGLMILTGARSPQYQIAAMGLHQPLPAVSKWSDVAFLQEMLYNGDSAMRTGSELAAPQWILVKDIYGPRDTLAVISRCLRFHGWTSPHLPDWAHRVTFPIGSASYDAILGTQNAAGVAWFLIEHKYKYGTTMLASVTVYSDLKINTGSPQGDHPVIAMPDVNPQLGSTEMPNLLWWSGSLELAITGSRANRGFNLVEIRDVNRALEQGNRYSILHQDQWANPNFQAAPSPWKFSLKPAY
ncbi:hypothetical protein DOTSEDRAFT_38437 [Dothistroma septosporum NZE10]|uniref:Uncharacterized protein n=1 Tax=Dothistroma septosporum (strain NZE10 / CBS 128990) TaxID=675120 RepID=M2YJZ2_DOTSN|nr:hypothetical protein DOTSEDRAFT_38437 [Dothistroma septosporum NZE10]